MQRTGERSTTWTRQRTSVQARPLAAALGYTRSMNLIDLILLGLHQQDFEPAGSPKLNKHYGAKYLHNWVYVEQHTGA